MNSKVLIVFTSMFPYGNAESFLESEIRYYDKFSKIYFVPLQATEIDKKRCRPIPLRNYEILDIDGNSLSFSSIVINLFRTLLVYEFYKEAKNALKRKGMRGFIELLKFTVIGEDRINKLKRIYGDKLTCLKGNGLVLYSYWMHIPAYVMLRLFKNSELVVSRCHGFDLYEFRNGYIPYRQYILNNLDLIICISQNGTTYIKNKYAEFADKVKLFRLGTEDYGIEKLDNAAVFSLISCSRVVDIKRVGRIVDALKLIKHCKISWTHAGDGPLLEEVQKYACSELKDSEIIVSFVGEKSNQEIFSMYQNNTYHCFINVSVTEGVPVSIMEAISFGIPVIATDVGGTSEILDNTNAILLRKEFTDRELADAILKIKKISDSCLYSSMRLQSRKLWEERCNADKNYRKFVSSLLNIK